MSGSGSPVRSPGRHVRPDPGRNGRPGGRLLWTVLAAAVWAQGLAAAPAAAGLMRVIRIEGQESVAVAGARTGTGDPAAAGRDSLLQEIRRYSTIIADMRDSLALSKAGIELSAERRERIENSIEDITAMVEDIGQELSRLDLKIHDNHISLLNEAGEGIVINIPENLDKNISEGLNAITQLILSELPDSISFDSHKTWNWSGFTTPPAPPPPPRRVIPGNVVKVGDDLIVAEDEDIRGNVVVVLGNAEIAGRVDGNVVVVMGDLQVVRTAEVEGKVVTVGGSLDQDPQAEVGEVVVVDPLRGSRAGLTGILGEGPAPFLILQGIFVLTLVLAGLAAGLAPKRRFEAVTAELRKSPAADLGVGIMVSIAGNSIAMVFMGVLVLTVIGLPLALLVGTAVGLISILAVAVAAAVVGDKACAMAGRPCPSPILAVVAGVVLLHLVSFVAALAGTWTPLGGLALPLGLLGLTIKILAYLFGLGALVKSRIGTA